jgi:glycerate 2-kinase
VDAIEPGRLVTAALSRTDLASTLSRPIFVVAAGKAAWPMACAFCAHDAVGGVLAEGMRAPAGVQGLVSGPRGAGALPRTLEWYEGSHPSPNRASEAAGRRALAGASSTREGGALVVLLSGGASSLLAVPADDLSLGDKIATSRALMDAGAPIADLNCVRKHLSAIKGGRLAAAAGRSMTWAISDVHGPVPDDPSVIGSGPTVGDPTTFEDALAIVRKSGALAAIPAAVLRHLERGSDETPTPGDPSLAAASYEVIGTRRLAMEGAAAAARARGYDVAIVAAPSAGEARVAGAAFIAQALGQVAGAGRPVCVIASGETVVHVTGTGRGGRNQEFVLAALGPLAAAPTGATLGSAGTDGIDGPTDAAGAIADTSSADRAAAARLDRRAALANNASYDFFRALDDLIVWGPTGTNVGDVHVLLAGGDGPSV